MTPQTEMYSIGLAFRKARKGLAGRPNRYDIGEKAGISDHTVANIEHGSIKTGFVTHFELADALGTPAWKLFQAARRVPKTEAQRMERIGAVLEVIAGLSEEKLELVSKLTKAVVDYDQGVKPGNTAGAKKKTATKK